MGFTNDSRVMQSVAMESEVYGDIIQEDFVDSYKNLTYKVHPHLQAAQRAVNACRVLCGCGGRQGTVRRLRTL